MHRAVINVLLKVLLKSLALYNIAFVSIAPTQQGKWSKFIVIIHVLLLLYILGNVYSNYWNVSTVNRLLYTEVDYEKPVLLTGKLRKPWQKCVSRNIRKHTCGHVRQAKIQIRPCIRAKDAEFLHANNEDSD